MVKIKWIKVGEREPDNSGQAYNGSPCTPYVPCIVWACYPGVIHGGTASMLRWDTKNKCWHQGEIASNWQLQTPYEITHFCDSKIFHPGSPENKFEEDILYPDGFGDPDYGPYT